MVVRRMLPAGWEGQARALGALQRARGVPDARVLPRLLWLHLAQGCSLAETAAQARQAGWCRVTAAAVFWRLQSAEHWLAWRTQPLWPTGQWLSAGPGRRGLAIDATTVCESGPTGSQWRLHFALNLATRRCE